MHPKVGFKIQSFEEGTFGPTNYTYMHLGYVSKRFDEAFSNIALAKIWPRRNGWRVLVAEQKLDLTDGATDGWKDLSIEQGWTLSWFDTAAAHSSNATDKQEKQHCIGKHQEELTMKEFLLQSKGLILQMVLQMDGRIYQVSRTDQSLPCQA